MPFDNTVFHITTVVHPSTYLNKVVFGSQQGSLQLWNIKTSKMLYEFAGWGAAVTVLEQVKLKFKTYCVSTLSNAMYFLWPVLQVNYRIIRNKDTHLINAPRS